MEIEKISTKFCIRTLTDSDIPQIYELCKNNPVYYQHCPPFVSIESIQKDMSALPPHKTMEDKFYVGYFDGNKLIAVLDLICEFPDKDTVFIGFFMMDIAMQHNGVGTKLIDDLCLYLQQQGYSHIRLSWVKGNPQSEHFWHKNGFIETGVTSQTENYTMIFAQREL